MSALTLFASVLLGGMIPTGQETSEEIQKEVIHPLHLAHRTKRPKAARVLSRVRGPFDAL